MSSIIKAKRGTTTPTTGLAEHEIAVDTTAKRIYIGALDGSGILIGSAPAGSTTQVQFNNAGVLGASAGLVFDSANEIFRVRSHPTRYFTIGGNAAGASEILGYGNRPLAINSVENSIDIGDVDAVVNSTYIKIDDPSSAMYISCPNGTINVDSPTVMLTQGSLTLGASAIITAPSATALAIKSEVPAGTGVTPTIQVICPSAVFTLTNGTATQAVFNTPQDTISLQASTTYMVEGQYLLQTGTTSHTTTISFVSSGAITSPSIAYTTIASQHSSANATSRTQDTSFFTSIAGGIVATASVLPNTIISFKGILRTTHAGNLVPNILFSVAPGSTNYILVGSYIKFYPIGADTINSVGTAIG